MRTNGSDDPAFQPGKATEEKLADGLGLTKREAAAVQIMAGLLAASLSDEVPDTKHLSHVAVGGADALFDELAKEN